MLLLSVNNPVGNFLPSVIKFYKMDIWFFSSPSLQDYSFAYKNSIIKPHKRCFDLCLCFSHHTSNTYEGVGGVVRTSWKFLQEQKLKVLEYFQALEVNISKIFMYWEHFSQWMKVVLSAKKTDYCNQCTCSKWKR